MQKVLIMIDSFKGTLDSKDLGKTMKNIFSNHQIKADYVSISDGGEGFYDAINAHLPLKKVPITLTTLDLRKKQTYYYINKDTAYIEVAQYIGFKGFNKGKNPLKYTSYAIGEIIHHIHNSGIKNIIIGLGGSLTNDFGLGLLEALGVKFFSDKPMKKLRPIDINHIKEVDISSLDKYKDLCITILSDVTNPLFGSEGATFVFGRQKGLNKKHLPMMESAGKHLYDLLLKAGLKDTKDEPGAGAAGGLGNIFKSIFNTKTLKGINYILDLMNFDALIKNYDYLITGEGKIDKQSLSGKVVFEIAKRSDKPVILVCALSEITLEEATVIHENIKGLFSIVPSLASVEESLQNPKKYFTALCNHMLEHMFMVK